MDTWNQNFNIHLLPGFSSTKLTKSGQAVGGLVKAWNKNLTLVVFNPLKKSMRKKLV